MSIYLYAFQEFLRKKIVYIDIFHKLLYYKKRLQKTVILIITYLFLASPKFVLLFFMNTINIQLLITSIYF